MSSLRLKQICEQVQCDGCGEPVIVPTELYTWDRQHACGNWTPKDGIFCAFCGEPLTDEDDDCDGDNDAEDDDEPSPSGPSCCPDFSVN